MSNEEKLHNHCGQECGECEKEHKEHSKEVARKAGCLIVDTDIFQQDEFKRAKHCAHCKEAMLRGIEFMNMLGGNARIIINKDGDYEFEDMDEKSFLPAKIKAKKFQDMKDNVKLFCDDIIEFLKKKENDDK